MKFFEAPELPYWLDRQLPFNRRMASLSEGNMHFIDHGEGPVVLLMHGNPTWSYLWRKVIARLLPAGVRVIAPDLFGFGLSTKPRRGEWHSLARHSQSLVELVEGLGLEEYTIVGQDWGGPIVGGLAARLPDRIKGAVFANTSLLLPKTPIRSTLFHRFSHTPYLSELAFISFLFPLPTLHTVQGDRSSLDRHTMRAYYYPLQPQSARRGPLALARMVPHMTDHPTMPELGRVDEWFQNYPGPMEFVWGRKDPILGRAIYRFKKIHPQVPVLETGAGHFLQEEIPQELSEAVLRVMGKEVVVGS